MIIKKLVLNNYKTFYGHQELDLDIPDNSRQDNKNIILIGGLNGSGKTSILKAIHYSLFGKRGMSPEEYKRIFSNVINNTFFNEGGRECYIVLTVEVNNKEEWELKTKWIFDHSKIQVHETREITIRKPGARIGRTQIINNMETYNRFIDRTIPYHVAPFFIFDGEEIKDIILRQNSYEMKEAIQKLSGLEAYKALKTDLTDALSFLSTKIFKANASKSPETNQDKVKYELAETNKSLDEFKARKDKEENRKTKLLDQIQALKKERENKIKLNASSREVYVKKLTASETKLQSFETNFTKEFMDSAFDILLRDQYLLLQKELKKEESYMQQKLVKEASLVPYQNFISNLFEVELDPPLTSTQKENLMLSGEKIWSKLNKINSELEEIELLHDLNKEQHRKLMNLPIKTSQHLTNIYNQMEKERTLIQQYESEIRKAPESVDIEEENEKIDNLTKMLGEVELRLKSATRKINTLSEERARLSKKLTQTEKKEDNNNQYQEQFEAIALIIQFLDDYIEKLTKLKANFIHEQFKLMLNQLFRKQDEFGKIEFDMSSFTIRLYNDRNQEISVHDRSAGEMQIISSALITGSYQVIPLCATYDYRYAAGKTG